MKLTVHVRSGSMAGRSFEFTGDRVRVGRQPGLELSLDPEKDLAVSAVHAELFRTKSGWKVRDLESSNGTFVDGRRIRKPTKVRGGTRILFGTGGPEVEVRAGDDGPVVAPTWIHSAVSEKSRLLKGVLAVSALALVALSATFIVPIYLQESASSAGAAAVVEAPDDPVPEVGGAPAAGAGSAATGAGATVEPGGSTGPGERGERVERVERAEPAEEALSQPPEPEPQRTPATLSFARIRADNGMAVALVYVETAGGELLTGSAFAVRRDGLLLTVRHVVLPDPDGPVPAKIAVQFANSSQVFPARLVATSTGDDLAAIRVERLVGEVPVVRGFNTRLDTLGTGFPVAILAVERAGERRASSGATQVGLVRSTLRAGIVSRIRADRLEVHGYGEPGGSGSPIFDSAGHVVGVLFGGLEDNPDQLLVAVNASRAAGFLARIP